MTNHVDINDNYLSDEFIFIKREACSSVLSDHWASVGTKIGPMKSNVLFCVLQSADRSFINQSINQLTGPVVCLAQILAVNRN